MAEFGPSDVAAVLQGVGAIAQAMAIFAAAWIASNTYNSWRKQKLSERRIEQAERILTATYNARRALGHVRRAILEPHETASAKEYLQKQDFFKERDSEQQSRLLSSWPYFDRLDAVKSERVAVDDCLPMARAIFGDDVEKALQTLNHQFEIIRIAIDSNDPWGNNVGFQEIIRTKLSSSKEINGVDEMTNVITAQIKVIEDHLLPILRLDLK